MNTSKQLAKHFKEVYYGGNWTWSNMKDQLSDVTWKEATTQVYSLNTIATLTYHIGYFVTAIKKVLAGAPLDSNDKFSFDHPPVTSQKEWEDLLAKTWTEADQLIPLFEQLDEKKLWETFVKEKYGIYFRNILGLIEHTHYHLGQIAVIKKIVRQKSKE